jgi:hypothetical protein
MSETLKRFVTSIRSLFTPSEDADPIHIMSNIEPESEESEHLTLHEAAGFEIEREAEG